MLLNILLLIFAYYLPFYLILVLYLQTKIKGYSVRSDTVSFLTASKKPWGSVFDVSMFFYGLLSLTLPTGLIILLGVNTLTVLGALFVGMTGLAAMLVGIFPITRELRKHKLSGVLAYLNVFLTAATFILIFDKYGFPPIMNYLCLWIIGTMIPLAVTAISKKKIYPLFEWLTFVGTIAWNFGLAISLLIRL